MKTLLVFLTIISNILAQDLKPAIEVKPAPKADLWIDLYKKSSYNTHAFLQYTGTDQKEGLAKGHFLKANKAVSDALDKMVTEGELIKKTFTFEMKKLTPEQQQAFGRLMQSTFIKYGQITGAEMLGLGHKKQLTLKPDDVQLVLETRATKVMHDCLTAISINQNLDQLSYPDTRVSDGSPEKTLWIAYLSSASELENKFRYGAAAFKSNAELVADLESIFTILLRAELFHTKTYPFSYDQLSAEDKLKFSAIHGPLSTKLGESAAAELLGMGRLAFYYKVQPDAKPSLTIHLPKAEFDQATKILDAVKTPQPATKDK